MAAAAYAMNHPAIYAAAQRAGQAGRHIARGRAGEPARIKTLPPPLSRWTSSRDLPAPPRETFQQWWVRRGKGGAP